MDNQPQQDTELNSLEDPGTNTSAPANASASTANAEGKSAEPKKKPGLKGRVQRLISHLNVYLLLFILIVVIVAGFTLISIQKNKKEAAQSTIQTQALTQDTLNKLNGTSSSVGDPKQTLSIESNAIFSGQVLIRDSLDVAGTIKVGGSLTLPGINVSGTSSFDQLQANKITSAGDANIQGQLTVQKNLTVSGGASFGGPITAPQITVQSFQLSGDLQLQRHIDAGGGTPGKTDGNALGSGGTSSVSGTDTAGTITINTGGSPGVGCFITVTFTQKFNATAHVVVSPVGAAAGGINYYVTRTNGSFSLCTVNPAPAGVSFSFDWVAID